MVSSLTQFLKESTLAVVENEEQTKSFLKSLGFPDLKIHHSINHFDFTKKNRKILVIGPMGSGKTEFSARIWRDSKVALKKSNMVKGMTTDGDADRRIVFYIRSKIDSRRFEDYPEDALPYRGGYERLGDNIQRIENSFDLEGILETNPHVGTWIIDEAGFFDERIAYIVQNYSTSRTRELHIPHADSQFQKRHF